MRDFNNKGNIKVCGDFNLTDNSLNEHKLLINYSNEELLQERPFRQGNIKLEQKRKIKRLQPLYGITVCVFITAAIWATIKGKPDIVTLILGVGSLLIGYQSFKKTLEPNSFQIEEQDAVDEINKIFKQRRFEG